MPALRILALVFALVISPAFADQHVVTYLQVDGRIIELAENRVDQLYGPAGAMMAIDSPELVTGSNWDRIPVDTMIIRYWLREGDDWIIVYFKETGTEKRFHRSDVKTIFVDRPWYEEPDVPSEVKPV